jgi:hypothetical protein
MILGGNIVGRVADLVVVAVGGSLVPLPDPGLPLGARVQLQLVPGSTYTVRGGSSRGTRRLVMLDGPQRLVLRVPRAGDIPARLDLQLRPVVAPRMARATSTEILAAAPDRDTVFILPPAIRALLPSSSGPIPQ